MDRTCLAERMKYANAIVTAQYIHLTTEAYYVLQKFAIKNLNLP